MRRQARGALVAGLAVLGCVLSNGCSSRTVRVEYARAEPIEDVAPSMPPAVGVAGGILNPSDTAPTPEQLMRRPGPDEEGDATQDPSYAVIDQANRASSEDPSASTYFNAVHVYQYDPGRLYQVYTAPARITDIALQPGERIVGEPASGDTVQWAVARGKSMEDGIEQQHLYLKPFRPGLHSNLIINTDRRTYLLMIHSYNETFMAGVKWRYPREEVAALAAKVSDAAEAKKAGTPVVSLASLNFGYRIEVVEGEPSWTPQQVFDDGAKTIIRFPASMSVREAPGLFVVRNEETQLANYRIRPRPGRTGVDYELDRLIDMAELRLGQDDAAEVVQITREGAP